MPYWYLAPLGFAVAGVLLYLCRPALYRAEAEMSLLLFRSLQQQQEPVWLERLTCLQRRSISDNKPSPTACKAGSKAACSACRPWDSVRWQRYSSIRQHVGVLLAGF